MSPDLLALLEDLFLAATGGDASKLDELYSPEFSAFTVRSVEGSQEIPRAELLRLVESADGDAWSPRSLSDVEVLHTSVEGGVGVVVYRWAGYGPPMVFTLAWDLSVDPPRLQRAFAAEPEA